MWRRSGTAFGGGVAPHSLSIADSTAPPSFEVTDDVRSDLDRVDPWRLSRVEPDAISRVETLDNSFVGVRPPIAAAPGIKRGEEHHEQSVSTQPTSVASARSRTRSVGPRDVYGLAPDYESQQREFNMMMSASVRGSEDLLVYGRPENASDENDGGDVHIRGTRAKLYLNPNESLAGLELAISKNTLQPPREFLTRHKMSTLLDSSFVPAPKVELPDSTALTKIPPLLKPSFLEVDVNEENDEDNGVYTMLRRTARRVPSSSDYEVFQGTQQPKYVPLTVAPKDEDEVHWTPPPDNATDLAAKKHQQFFVTEATVAERPLPPPSSTRNIAELYRVRQRLVAYDESEGFGFRARPIGQTEFVQALKDEMLQEQASGALPVDAHVVTVRHRSMCYVFAANRKSMLVLHTSDDSGTGAVAGRWDRVAIQDGSLFYDVSAIPQPQSLIVPIPNVPYFIAATASQLHIFSIEDATWYVCFLKGIAELKMLGWYHLIDHETLYVRDKTKKMHGRIPLRDVLEELTIFRRNPHDVVGAASFFHASNLKDLHCEKLRLHPCSESLVAIDNVPGVAVQPVADQRHSWIFIFHAVAKTFIPFKRLDYSTLFFVPMENHLGERDATTVLFFSEELRRLDIGSRVSENLSRSVGGARSSGVTTQRILRVANRLIVRHAPPPPCGDNATTAVPSTDRDGSPPPKRSRAVGGAATTSRRRFVAESKAPEVLRWKPLGATTAAFEQQLTLIDVPEKEMDTIIKARRSEVHTVLPMFDRCAAVLSFDCKAYAVVELDRNAWIRVLSAVSSRGESDDTVR